MRYAVTVNDESCVLDADTAIDAIDMVLEIIKTEQKEVCKANKIQITVRRVIVFNKE